MKEVDRRFLEREIRSDFADSLDLDAAMKKDHPQENRWDYLLGRRTNAAIIGIEPHSARQDEIGTVISKKEAAMDQLKDHLRPGKRVSDWFWVASGKVQFADTEKARRRLDEKGICFVGHQLGAGHLR